MKATSFSSSISQVFGQAMKKRPTGHTWPERNLWPPHFRTFCELVEGEENKLTTLSTRTIMLGCNESNIIFQLWNEVVAHVRFLWCFSGFLLFVDHMISH